MHVWVVGEHFVLCFLLVCALFLRDARHIRLRGTAPRPDVCLMVADALGVMAPGAEMTRAPAKKGCCGLCRMSTDTLLAIFRHLGLRERARAECVSRFWRTVRVHSGSSLRVEEDVQINPRRTHTGSIS